MSICLHCSYLGAGLRLGWVTAQPQVIDKLTMTIQVGGGWSVGLAWAVPYTKLTPMPASLPAQSSYLRLHPLLLLVQSHTVGPCSLSQVLTAEVLSHWGDARLDAHLRGVQREYALRAACITAAAQKVIAGCGGWHRGGGAERCSCDGAVWPVMSTPTDLLFTPYLRPPFCTCSTWQVWPSGRCRQLACFCGSAC